MKFKEDDKKRKTLSITIDNELFKIINEKTNNRSMYISLVILEKLKELNINVSKIKL